MFHMKRSGIGNRLSVFLFLFASQSCNGQFETVISAPPEVPPIVVASNTQLNLGEGSLVETMFAGSRTTSNEYVQVNLQGGRIEGILTVNQGAEVNIDDGLVNTLIASRDSQAMIRGGELFDVHGGRGSSLMFAGGQVRAGVLSYGNVTISDGIFEGPVEAAESSYFHVSDGQFSDGLIASIGSTTSIVGGNFLKKVTAQGTDITVAGGTFEDEFTVLSRDKLKIFGTSFLFDGEPITDLTTLGETATLGRVILRGDVPVLNAVLLDGNSLTIHLNRQEVPNQGWFHNGSTIDVTLAIPFEACDINDNGHCDDGDLDSVLESIQVGDSQHDLDGNGIVDWSDVDAWLVSSGIQNLGAPFIHGRRKLRRSR